MYLAIFLMLNYLCLNGSQKKASVRELLALTIGTEYKIKILYEYESFSTTIFFTPPSLPF